MTLPLHEVSVHLMKQKQEQNYHFRSSIITSFNLYALDMGQI